MEAKVRLVVQDTMAHLYFIGEDGTEQEIFFVSAAFSLAIENRTPVLTVKLPMESLDFTMPAEFVKIVQQQGNK